MAKKFRINVTGMSRQLPSLLLFENGKEVVRFPPFDKQGRVGKVLRFKEKEIIKHKIHYDSFPLNCLPSGIKLVKLSGKDLPKITAPILIMQSKTDKVLAIENIDFIYNKISSKIKKKVIIPDSYHVFLIDKYKEDAFKEIYSFIKEIEELNEKPILTTPIKV